MCLNGLVYETKSPNFRLCVYEPGVLGAFLTITQACTHTPKGQCQFGVKARTTALKPMYLKGSVMVCRVQGWFMFTSWEFTRDHIRHLFLKSTYSADAEDKRARSPQRCVCSRMIVIVMLRLRYASLLSLLREVCLTTAWYDERICAICAINPILTLILAEYVYFNFGIVDVELSTACLAAR